MQRSVSAHERTMIYIVGMLQCWASNGVTYSDTVSWH